MIILCAAIGEKVPPVFGAPGKWPAGSIALGNNAQRAGLANAVDAFMVIAGAIGGAAQRAGRCVGACHHPTCLVIRTAAHRKIALLLFLFAGSAGGFTPYRGAGILPVGRALNEYGI